MIIQKNQNYVETNMTGATSFSIKASAKAFKILSDGLYSDKIRAVIRELSCNALDSHTAAGCPDKPITVHLPNKLEPWFSVADEGLGLSKESVLKLYTTYFESTKTDSNDQIGALGLGSKSPFSYTDSFTIVSRFNGVESLYSAYIGPAGEPSIQHIIDTETSEPNGVEIKFGVKNDDIKVFRDKAAFVFRAFKIHPTIVGNSEYTPLSRGDILVEGDGWTIHKNTSSYRQPFAVQGNIEYPIDTSNITNMSNNEYFVLKQHIFIDFPIGDLDIAASREQLGYDEVTVENIRAKAEEIYQSIVDSCNKLIEDCPNFWSACIKAKEVLSNIYNGSNYITMTWQGKEINTSFSFEKFNNIIRFSPTHTKIAVKKENNITYQSAKSDIVFVKMDVIYKNKCSTNLRYYVKQTGKSIIVFHSDSFLDSVGNPDYLVYSTDIPDAPKSNTVYTKSVSHKLGCNFKRYGGSYYNDTQFRSTYGNFDSIVGSSVKTVYYIKILGNDSADNFDYKEMYDFATYTGILNDESKLVGIKRLAFEKPQFKADLNDYPGVEFIEFKPFMTEYMKEFMGKPSVQMLKKSITLKASFDSSSIRENDIVSFYKTNKDKFSDDTNLASLADDISSAYHICEKMDMKEGVYKFISKHIKEDEKHHIEKMLREHYPMLLCVRNINSYTHDEMIVDYINTIDSIKIKQTCDNITQINKKEVKCSTAETL